MSAGKDPNVSTGVPRVLEFAPACKQLALILTAVYAASFFTTWYRVWWDSLLGLLVAAFGYHTLRDTHAELNQKRVTFYYYATIATMVSHVIAVAVVIYYIIKIHFHNDLIRLAEVHESDPGVALFVFLILFLCAEIVVTGFAIQRGANLCAELARNDFFARGGASRV